MASGLEGRAREAAPAVALALALTATAVLLANWFGELTFWRDEWAFLLHRRGTDPAVFFEPHYEHIAVLHVALYKSLLAIFGMASPAPFQTASIALFLLSVVLLFVWLRRRLGPWVALAGCLPVLVLGAAWDDLLWPFQAGFFLSMTSGLAALIALERRDLKGDVVAVVLLIVSLFSSSLGIPFAVGVLVDVLVRRRPGRAWIAVAPIALYGMWWLGWGREADTYLSLHNLVTNPSYVLDGFAASVASLFGLASYPDEPIQESLRWGRPLLVVGVVGAVVALRRRDSVPERLWVVLAIAVAFWFLAGANASVFREPTSGRYQFMGVVFLLLIAAEVFRGVRIGPRALGAIAAVAVVATVANFRVLEAQYENLRPSGELQRAGLAALEIARDQVAPEFELTGDNASVDYLGELDAASYLDAADRHGSPAYTPEELAAASESARATADRVFFYGLEVRATPVEGGPAARCSPLAAGEVVALPPGGAVLRTSGATGLRLRRFAQAEFGAELELPAAGRFELAIPRDRSTEPWELAATRDLSVCRERRA